MRRGTLKGINALLVLGLLLVQASPAFCFMSIRQQDKVDAENIVSLTGLASKHVLVTGTVMSSKLSDNSKVVFLNFGKNFNTSLSAVIYDFDFKSFAEVGISSPETYFRNKKVSLEGKIRIANGKPEIVISSPKQIKIID